MNTVPLLILVVFHSVFWMNVQSKATVYSIIEVPLQPRWTDSDGRSAILGNENSYRVSRSSSSCQIPHKLENSNLTCVSYPSKIKCIQTCMFGYTFSEGIHRKMSCDYFWNKWTPVPEFESCEPFVDCGMALSSGGALKCYTHFMDRGTQCEISCHHYEDKPAIPAKMYECNIDGSWSPQLPFCARAGSGIALVAPPRY